MSRSAPAEIALCAAWHDGALPSQFSTFDGASVEVVHRGAWTHGLGPDFRDALVLFGGRELQAGAIEFHLRTRGWIDHGHHLDPAYNTVILHLVLHHDAIATRRHDGAIVPVAVLNWPDGGYATDLATWDWDRVGAASCAEDLTARQPTVIRDILDRLGDRRLSTRAARIEARLTATAPAEILWGELLDGLGFSANREPMRALSQRVPLTALEGLLQSTPAAARLAASRAALLGAAGFLPLAPAEAHLGHLSPDDVAALETAWAHSAGAWREVRMPPSAWIRSRVRPANHPVARLLAAASLIANASQRGGLLATMLAILTDRDDPAAALRESTASEAAAATGIGIDRAIDILASGVIPFALAFAAVNGDDALAAAASRHWATLPAPAKNAVTSRAIRQVAGSARTPKIGVRGAQGLIHLDTVLCQSRRCFECPVAAAVLAPHREKGPEFTSKT